MGWTIIKDGSLRGRFVALCTTAVTWGLFIPAFAGVEAFVSGWERIGDKYLYAYLGTMGLWMAGQTAVKIPEILGKVKEKIEEAKANGKTKTE